MLALSKTPFTDLGFTFLQLILVTLILYAAFSSIPALPFLKKWLVHPVAKLVFGLVFILICGYLVYWITPFRFLHRFILTKPVPELLWPDVILSALALFRLAMLWELLFGWLEKKSA